MLDYVAALEATGVDTEEMRDCLVIREFTLRQLAREGEPLNDTYRDVATFVEPVDHYTSEYFPREMFMDYVPLTPKFGVGDIVFKLDYGDGDTDQPRIDEVVITCVLSDVFGVTYNVALHEPHEYMCTSELLEIEEDLLSFNRLELDPRRGRLQIVK